VPISSAITAPTSPSRQFSVARDELGTLRIVNDTSRHTIAALSRREAKQLSRELRRVLKNSSKS
jgi:membrane protein YdbS with pleckstrin-like domain